MSRSWRTHPCGQICCCKSERWDKDYWHGNFRSRGRRSCRRLMRERMLSAWTAGRGRDRRLVSRIDVETEDWELDAFSIRQVSNPWLMNKDGKMWYVEDYRNKRDRVFKGKRVLWYRFTEAVWCTDREIRRLMAK